MQKEVSMLRFAGILGLMVVVGAMASFFSVDSDDRKDFQANVFNFATGNEEATIDEVDSYLIPQTYADEMEKLEIQEVKVKIKRGSQDSEVPAESQELKVSKVKKYVEEVDIEDVKALEE